MSALPFIIPDPTTTGQQMTFLLNLLGITTTITKEQVLVRDYNAALASLNSGLKELSTLPNTSKTWTKLNRQRRKAVKKSKTDVAAATQILQKAITACKQAIKDGKKALKDDIQRRTQEARDQRKAAINQVKYDAKRKELTELLDKIDAEPLMMRVGDLGSRIRQLHVGRSQADEKSENGDHSGATGAIKALIKEANSVISTWNSSLKNSKKNLKSEHNPWPKYEQLAQLVKTDVLVAEERDAILDVANKKMVQLLDLTAKKTSKQDQRDKGAEIKQELDDYYGEIALKIDALVKKQERVGKHVQIVATRTENLLNMALASEVVDELTWVAESKRFFNQNMFDKAKELADKANSAYASLESTLFQNKSAWEQIVSTALPELRSAILKQARDAAEGGVDFAFPFAHTALVGRLGEIGGQVMKSRSHKEAIALFNEIKADHQKNVDALSKWGGLSSERGDADQKVKEAESAVKASLKTLETALKKSEKGDQESSDWSPHDMGGFADKLSEIMNEWKTTLNSAVDEPSIDPAATVQELKDLKAEIDKMVSNPKTVTSLVSLDKLSAIIAQFDKKQQKVVDGMQEWKLYPTPTYPRLAEALGPIGAIVGKARSDGDAMLKAQNAAGINALIPTVQTQIDALKKLEETCKSEIVLIQGLLEEHRSALEKRCDRVAKLLEKGAGVARKKTIWPETRKIRARCAEEIKTLQERLETVRAMKTTLVLNVYNMATTQLNELESRGKELKILAGDKRDSEEIESAEKTAKELLKYKRGLIDRKDFRRFRPSDRYTLGKKLDDIAKLVGKEHSTRVDAAFVEWNAEYKKALALVERDKRENTAFKKLYKKAITALNEATGAYHLDRYPKLLEKLKGDLSGAYAQSKTEDGIRSADARVRTMLGTLAQMKKTKPKKLGDALKKQDDQAAAASDKARLDKKTFEARADAYAKEWQKKIKSGVLFNKKYNEEVKPLLDLALKTAGNKPPDFDTANRYLAAAASRAALLIEFPDGPAATSLKKLPSVNAAWAKGVNTFKSKLNDAISYFQNAELDEDTTQNQKIQAAIVAGLRDLSTLFDANAFGVIVQNLCNTGADRDTRFKQRETGLALVRRYNDIIVQDSRFRLLADHPFEMDTWTAHFDLKKPLLDFERLLKMAVSVKE
ncbi:MAG: hypothetical protein AAFV53_14650 [Myxococcota bacterium]